VAAVLLEIIQGEGGVWQATAEYLAAAERLCRERGVLLMLDEVQTGFFRTGPAFAHQAFGLSPDVVTLAKAMANGLPIGAVVAREEVASAFKTGDHGSTFGGGPVVCAAGRATVAALESERLGENSTVSGAYLRAGLASLGAAVSDVRGAGLMCGCTLDSPRALEVAARLLDEGVIVNHIGMDILRFLPPLVCSKGEIDTLLSTLSDVLEEVAR
jgi:acetylornithine aminotransferase